jgi:hypothetical protein
MPVGVILGIESAGFDEEVIRAVEGSGDDAEGLVGVEVVRVGLSMIGAMIKDLWKDHQWH